MQASLFSLASLPILGRRRLWWSRKPSKATAVADVETKANIIGGQLSRPALSNLAFEAPAAAPSTATARFTHVLAAGALVRAFNLYLRTPKVLYCAPLPEGTDNAGATPFTRAPGAHVGANGQWYGLDLRPLSVVENAREALLAANLKARGLRYTHPLGLARSATLLRRVSRDWDLQCRVYAAAWVVYREASLLPVPKEFSPLRGKIKVDRVDMGLAVGNLGGLWEKCPLRMRIGGPKTFPLCSGAVINMGPLAAGHQ